MQVFHFPPQLDLNFLQDHLNIFDWLKCGFPWMSFDSNSLSEMFQYGFNVIKSKVAPELEVVLYEAQVE